MRGRPIVAVGAGFQDLTMINTHHPPLSSGVTRLAKVGCRGMTRGLARGAGSVMALGTGAAGDRTVVKVAGDNRYLPGGISLTIGILRGYREIIFTIVD